MDWNQGLALKKLGYILRFYRRHRQYTQTQMAAALGISMRNYQRLEFGQIEPRLKTLVEISRLLDVPVSSLIRSSDKDTLFAGLGSKSEIKEFSRLNSSKQLESTELQFVKHLVVRDRIEDSKFQPKLYAQLDGNIAHVSPAMQKFLGSKSAKFDFQPFVVHGSAVERWELAFRLKLKSAVMENAILTSTGIKFVREFHVNLNADPECPTSEVYFEDITERHSLEQWIRVRQHGSV